MEQEKTGQMGDNVFLISGTACHSGIFSVPAAGRSITAAGGVFFRTIFLLPGSSTLADFIQFRNQVQYIIGSGGAAFAGQTAGSLLS